MGKTLHHPIPQALLGDYAHPIPEDDHEGFHRACGYLSPDMMLRRLSYSCFRTKNISLPFDNAKKVLEILSPNDWHSLYSKSSFVNASALEKPQGKRAEANSAEHAHRFFLQEAYQIDDARLRISGMSAKNGATRDIENFFRTTSPALAMYRVLTEKVSNGDNTAHKWVSPMKSERIDALIELTSVKETEELSASVRREARRLLLSQQDRIARYQKSARRLLHKHEELILKMAKERNGSK